MDLIDRIKRIDAFPKFDEQFRVKTSSGAIVSLIAMVIMASLFLAELQYYLATQAVETFAVDPSRGQTLKLEFDVLFPDLPCAMISVDAVDVAGNHQLGVDHDVFKKRVDSRGRAFGSSERDELGGTIKSTEELQEIADKQASAPDKAVKREEECGSCYGAKPPGECCNSCEEIRSAYRRKGWAISNLKFEQCESEGLQSAFKTQKGEGCNVYGSVEVSKAAGNIHFAPGTAFQSAHVHVHDLMSFTLSEFNTSHTIRSFSVGSPVPGVANPLDGAERTLDKGSAAFQYYLKVVPTTFEPLRGPTVQSNQYAVTEHVQPISPAAQRGLPGVFFYYDISSVAVTITETRRGFFQFATSACAITGGVFTGLVDKAVHTAMGQLRSRASTLHM